MAAELLNSHMTTEMRLGRVAHLAVTASIILVNTRIMADRPNFLVRLA